MNRKRTLLIASILLSLLILAHIIALKHELPPPKPEQIVTTIRTYYFPLAIKNLCQPADGKHVSIAWPDYPYESMTLLCGEDYYAYDRRFTNIAQYESGKRIPILWCDYDSRTDVDFAELSLNLARFDKTVIDLNEPDLISQCGLTPDKAAEVIRLYEQRIPNAEHVYPNISQHGVEYKINDQTGEVLLSWLEQFIGYYFIKYDTLPQPAHWSFHLYASNGYDLNLVDRVCDILEKFDYVCENLWVTEIGSCSTYWMEELTKRLLADPRIDRIFLFSNTNFGCLSYLTPDGQKLSPIGEAYLRGRFGVQPYP